MCFQAPPLQGPKTFDPDDAHGGNRTTASQSPRPEIPGSSRQELIRFGSVRLVVGCLEDLHCRLADVIADHAGRSSGLASPRRWRGSRRVARKTRRVCIADDRIQKQQVTNSGSAAVVRLVVVKLGLSVLAKGAVPKHGTACDQQLEPGVTQNLAWLLRHSGAVDRDRSG